MRSDANADPAGGDQTGAGHPGFARFYARFSEQSDARGGDAHRRALLAGLRGRVVEIGAGNGRNFAHYPPEVTAVVAVEPEPFLRERAIEAAATARAPIEIVDGRAEALPLDDGAVDAAVFSLVLCSIEEPLAALAEARRVLRPGGELRFYEHVRGRGAMAAVQRALDATFWPRLFGGCHTARDTTATIAAAGFELETVDRFGFRPATLGVAVPHVIGTARRSA